MHITYIGQHITPDRWKHFPRTANEHIMYAVYAGEMYIREEETQYHLKEGDIILLEAGKNHTGYHTSSCSYYYVHFTPIEQLRAVAETDSWQREQIQRILQMNYNTSPLSDAFYSDLQLVFPKYIHIENVSAFHGILSSLQASLQYHQARQTIFAYLNSIRLEQAKQLLLTTHLSLSEIAVRTGFSDVYYFSRVFKKALNVSPACFRKTRTVPAYPCPAQPVSGSSHLQSRNPSDSR